MTASLVKLRLPGRIRAETVRMHSGPSYFAELTIGETSWASISSAGRGFNSDWALAKDIRETSSHCSSSSGRRITGIRLWTGRTSSLGSVVMMVNDSTRFPSGLRHTSHRPARANGCLV